MNDQMKKSTTTETNEQETKEAITKKLLEDPDIRKDLSSNLKQETVFVLFITFSVIFITIYCFIMRITVYWVIILLWILLFLTIRSFIRLKQSHKIFQKKYKLQI
jgi:Flp pilus assembly protein TadB